MCAVTDRDSDPPHLHVVEDFEEGEGHPTADDHLIHLVQHVIDQLDLIFHLCSGKQAETSALIRDVCDKDQQEHTKKKNQHQLKEGKQQTNIHSDFRN